MKTTADIINDIAASVLKTSPGALGMNRIMEIQGVLDRVLPEYSAALGLSPEAVLAAIEAKRDVSAPNYYQDSNFPRLEGVRVFDSPEAFAAAFPSRKYTCPACAGISTDPYACNAGTIRENGKPCNWKSYGLFGTMGKGLRAIVKSTFLESPRVHEIFMPVEAATGDSK